MIAQGKSNQAIADTLVVTKRTIEAHIGNIMFKLGYTSRTQIAVWAKAMTDALKLMCVLAHPDDESLDSGGMCILGPIAGISLALNLPTHLPSLAVIASALALALEGTTLTYICFYWLIDHVGSTRTVIVTYLLPCIALVYGALLLHEAIGINALGGLQFILLGIFFVGRRTTA